MLELAADVKPQEWTWKASLETRHRVERRLNADFLSSRSDDRTEWFARYRPGLTATGPGGARITLVYQFGYSESATPNRTTVRSNSDMMQANIDWASGKWRVNAGRQLFVIGEGRLFAGLQNWGNQSRTFDGIRLRNKEWDLFLVKQGLNTNFNPEQTALGTVFVNRLGQTFFLGFQDDRTKGLTRLGTVSHLWRRQTGRLSATAEGAYQFGHSRGVDTEAWMLYGKVGTQLNRTTELSFDVTAASGGQNATKNRTFLPPFPTGPTPYGFDQLNGYRNSTIASVKVTVRPQRGWTLRGHYDFVYLRDARDAWYALNNSVNPGPNGPYRDPTGAAGKEVGRLWQLEAMYEPNARTRFLVGMGIMTPGRFIRTLNGGRANDQTWGAALLLYRF